MCTWMSYGTDVWEIFAEHERITVVEVEDRPEHLVGIDSLGHKIHLEGG